MSVTGRRVLVTGAASGIGAEVARRFVDGPGSAWINGHDIVADGGTTGAVLSGPVPAPEI